ncbi:hypothetical protein HY772_06830 [Candidatus Woesearchaeota archaeon]|nr:hypothetical protein [Candidatus Woesearchaeota archaeon]
MDAMLVVFHLSEGTPSNVHKRFRRVIYGEATSSWGGRYRYHREGILDTVPHVWLYWGVVIIKSSDYKKLKEIFNQYPVVVKKRTVKCIKGDSRELSKSPNPEG